MEADVNFWAVLVSAIIAMSLGLFWYSPLVFGSSWSRLNGFFGQDKNKAGVVYMGSFVSLIIFSYVLAHLVELLVTTGVFEALRLAFWLWLGFVATITSFPLWWEQKSWRLYLINNSYYLLMLIVMTLIITIWP